MQFIARAVITLVLVFATGLATAEDASRRIRVFSLNPPEPPFELRGAPRLVASGLVSLEEWPGRWCGEYGVLAVVKGGNRTLFDVRGTRRLEWPNVPDVRTV